MKTKHTKGPWTFIHGNLSNGMENDHFAGDIRLTDDLQWSIAAVWNDCGEKEEVEANALLIAHSPEMFDLLTKIEAILSGPYERTTIDSERQKRTARIQRMIGDLLSKIEGI